MLPGAKQNRTNMFNSQGEQTGTGHQSGEKRVRETRDKRKHRNEAGERVTVHVSSYFIQ